MGVFFGRFLRNGEDGVRSLNHQRRFFANARPEARLQAFLERDSLLSLLNAT
jgi:hypothetical protein